MTERERLLKEIYEHKGGRYAEQIVAGGSVVHVMRICPSLIGFIEIFIKTMEG